MFQPILSLFPGSRKITPDFSDFGMDGIALDHLRLFSRGRPQRHCVFAHRVLDL
jgi:hypothetical protein